MRSVLHDVYANAFNYDSEGGPNQNDIRIPKMTPQVFEGKYELDSLAGIPLFPYSPILLFCYLGLIE